MTDEAAGAGVPRGLSLWWDGLPADLAAAIGTPLDGDADADVAIVGAGFTGLWTAWFLRRHAPGLRIRVIEAEVAGFGASGRNGGWASALIPISPETLSARAGRDAAARTLRTMEASVIDLGETIREEGWEARWAYGGTLGLARDAAQLQRARHEVAEAQAWGAMDTVLLDAAAAQERLHATRVLGGVVTPHCASIDPARLVRSLARSLAASGVLIHERTRAHAIEAGAVVTDRGTVRAPVVLRATEGYTRSLAGMRREIAPVYSLMLATAPLDAAMWERIGLRQRETFLDGRHVIIYGQRTADGRIAFGGRGAPYHFGSRIRPGQDRDPRVHRALRAALIDLLPVLADVDITHEWGGPLGIPRDWWPSIRFDPRTGLGSAGGYAGDGVTTSFLGGRTLADLVLGRDTDRARLPWVQHRAKDWEPEPLRWLGVNAGLVAMRMADRQEARTGRPSRVAAVASRLMGR